MGEMERVSAKRRRWGQVRYGLLATVGIAGVILVTAAAPNLLQLLRYVPKNRYRFQNQVQSTLARLADQRLITFVQRNGKKYAELTESGRRELLRQQLRFGLQRGRKRRWDKRWRVIIFDVPERSAPARQRLRNEMRSFGFYRLQDSVWIYPFDCEDVMALLKTDLRLGNAVRYMIADTIENDRALREHFNI